MGEGFIVLQTRKINIHFYMDEPGTHLHNMYIHIFIYIQCVYWYINTYCMYHSLGILDNKWESIYMFVLIKNDLTPNFVPRITELHVKYLFHL